MRGPGTVKVVALGFRASYDRRHRMHIRTFSLAVALCLLLIPGRVFAQGDEIQVYDGGLADVGTFNLT